MRIKILLALLAFQLINAKAFSQSISINTTGNAADTSAILDITSSSKGLLIPRMTQAQKLAIPLTAEGLLVYQTDGTKGFYYYNTSTGWTLLVAASGVITSLNGLTAATQTFATPGTTGTAPNWSSSGAAHTLNIPLANAAGTTAGLLSNSEWTTFNNKAGSIVLNGDGVLHPATTFSLSGGAASGSLALNNQPRNKILAGPASGSPLAPTFRYLVPGDIPIATTSLIGGVSIGSGLAITPEGILSATNINAGTVTSASVVTANGVSGTVATPTTTPAITLTLGAITPTSVAATGTVTGSNLSGTHSGNSSGTNTGDETTATIKTKLGTASSTTDGYLTTADWNTFNNKATALGYTAANDANVVHTTGTETVGGLKTFTGLITGADVNVNAATAPTYFWGSSANASRTGPGIISFGNGSRNDNTATLLAGKIGLGTSTITEALNVNGYSLATGYKVPSGTSSRFLKADGSIDSNTYITTSSANLQSVTNNDSATSHQLIIQGHRIGSKAGSPFTFFAGKDAGLNNTGDIFVNMGYEAGKGSSGVNNVAIGAFTGKNQSGDNFTGVGSNSGQSNTGNNVTAVGFYAAAANPYNNVNVIGSNASATANDQTIFGNPTNQIIINHPVVTGTGSNKYQKQNIGGTDYYVPLYTTASPPSSTNGTVTSVSVTSANGVSGTVANSTTTPAISFTLGAITPSSVAATGTIGGSNYSGTHSGASSGTNTGDETTATIKTKLGAASATADGYLTMADWNNFNNKLATIDTGNISNFYLKVRGLQSAGTGISYNNITGVISNSGVLSVNGNTGALTMDTAYIANFYQKVRGLNSASAPITYTNGQIGIAQATTSSNGYLSSTDWNTFNNKGLGSVTSASVVTANGLAGTVANATTTPAITLTTTVNGIAKGNGTALSAATSGTDYAPGTASNATGIVKSTTATGALTTAVAADFPVLNQNTTGSAGSFTGSLAGDVTGTQAATTVGKINGTSLSGLATGILKNTTTTGVPSIAVASDFPTLNQNTTGTSSNITGVLTAASHPALTGDVTNTAGSLATTISNGVVSNTKLSNMATQTFKGRTTAGTGSPEDLTATDATAMLNTFGTLKGLVPGVTSNTTQYLRADGTFAAPPGATSGTVTSASVVNANGLAGTVANATTTPAITLTTTVNGIAKGNGTALSAATSGTDYAPGTASNTTGIVKSTTATGALTTAVAADFPVLNQNTTGTAGSFTGSLAGDVTGTQAATTVGKINGTSLSGLATGILKNTTTTGVPSIAVASDFPVLNQNTTGSAGSFTGSLAGDVTGTQAATTVGKINGTSLSGLATGILKNTTTTGVPSIAVASDFPTLNQNTTGTASNITGVLTAASHPALTGDVTNTAGSLATTISNGVVSNTKLSNMATQTFKGRTTAGTGSPEDLNATDATAMLNTFGALKGLVPGVTSNTTQYLRADGSFAVPPGTNTTTGTVTSASVVTANGLAGTVANATTTPAITLTTTVNGIAKGNGTALSTATSGTDYAPGTASNATGIVKSTTATGALTTAVAADFPILNQNTTGTAGSFTGSLSGDVTGTQSATTVGKINGTSLSGLATGILKNTTTTGVPSIAVASDFPTLNQNTTGTSSNITGVLTAASHPALTGDVTNTAGSLATTISNGVVSNAKLANMTANSIKGNNTGSAAAAADLSGTQVTTLLDVFTPTAKGLVPLSGGGTTTYLRADGTFAAPPGATSGTVTSASVVTANGLAGTVANATTTPAITLTTTVNGIAKGNGTALSAATSGTDYAPGTAGNATGIVKSTTATGALTTAVAADFPILNQNTTGTAGSFTGSLAGDVTGTQSATTVGKINGTSLSGLATGILKNTTTTGVPSIAVASDFPTLNQNTTGTASNITGVLTAASHPALTGDVTNTAGSLATIISNGVVSNAKAANMATQTFKGRTTAGTGSPEDLNATDATAMLNTFGALKGLVPGVTSNTTQYLRADGSFAVPPGTNTTTGTVTSVSVTSANGVSGTVATNTTTPAISLTLGAITPTSVAASGTIGGSNYSGTHSGASSGTNTGDETTATIKTKLGAATSTTDGYLTMADWVTFNNKATTTGTWSTTGNTGTTLGTHFLGTTDLKSLRFRTNNTQAFLIDSAGNVAIGNGPIQSSGASSIEKFLVDAGSTSANPSSSFNVISGRGYLNSYLQLNIQNKSTGNGASSDVVATNDAGTEANGLNFIDMGVNSSGYTNANNNILNGPNNTYLYTTGNDMLIGNASSGKNIILFNGGTSNSNEAMRIDGSGNVGIGTTSPGSALDVKGTLRFSGASSGYVGFAPASSAGSTTYTLPSSDGASGQALTTNGSGTLAWASQSLTGWSTTGNAGTNISTNFLGTTDLKSLRFRTNNKQGMLLDSAGNVAIGNGPVQTSGTNIEKFLVDAGSTSANPSSSINVIAGKGYLNSYLQLNIQNKSAGTSASSDVVATADNGDESNNYIDMGINSSGNTANFFGDANDAYLFSASQDLLIGTAAANKTLSFLTGGGTQGTNERMRIDGSGNVGIGTTTPTSILSLGGQSARTIGMERNTTAATAGNALTLQASGSYTGGLNLNGGTLNISSGTSTGTGSSDISIKTATAAGSSSTADNAPSTKMTIKGSGNVGIGTTAPVAKLDVAGTVKIGSVGTALNNIIRGTVTITDNVNFSYTTTKLIYLGVSGALVGGTVIVNPRTALANSVVLAYSRISATNTIEVGFLSADTDTLGTITFDVTVIQ